MSFLSEYVAMLRDDASEIKEISANDFEHFHETYQDFLMHEGESSEHFLWFLWSDDPTVCDLYWTDRERYFARYLSEEEIEDLTEILEERPAFNSF